MLTYPALRSIALIAPSLGLWTGKTSACKSSVRAKTWVTGRLAPETSGYASGEHPDLIQILHNILSWPKSGGILSLRKTQVFEVPTASSIAAFISKGSTVQPSYSCEWKTASSVDVCRISEGSKLRISSGRRTSLDIGGRFANRIYTHGAAGRGGNHFSPAAEVILERSASRIPCGVTRGFLPVPCACRNQRKRTGTAVTERKPAERYR